MSIISLELVLWRSGDERIWEVSYLEIFFFCVICAVCLFVEIFDQGIVDAFLLVRRRRSTSLLEFTCADKAL